MLQYNSKSLILFVCGDGMAVCVEQNYIVRILDNINYVLTQILYWTSLKQRHFTIQSCVILPDVVLRVFCILKLWYKKGNLCLGNLIILNFIIWNAPLILTIANMEGCDVLWYHLHVAPKMICMLRLTQSAVAVLFWYDSNVHIEAWLLMCYYVRW